jgi:glycosyltransferase involved in cell wall biosynthesis
MPSRIVFDCERMKYPNTGLYHFCWHLGRALLRQARKEDEVCIFAPKSARLAFPEEVCFMEQRSLQKIFFPSLQGYDLWHCTYQGSHYFPKNKAPKIVLTVHDLNFLHDPGKPAAKKKRELKNLAEKIAEADAVVTISAYVQKELKEQIPVAESKLHIIYNGCNILPGIEPVAPARKIPAPFLLTIGTIAAKKNFHVLPAALLHNDYHLVIAGINQDEAYHQRIMAEARTLGVSGRVHYIGPVSEAEKHWLLQHCALFVFPSLAEGFGLPVIEALYFGKPVLLSSATSLPEVGGPHARYLENFDPEHISAMSRKTVEAFTAEDAAQCKEWAKRFSWEAAASDYHQLYKQILNA